MTPKKLIIIILLVGFLSGLFLIKMLWINRTVQLEGWYQVIYNEPVSIRDMKGVLKVLKIKDQIHLGKSAPPLPEESVSMLKNYSLFLQMDILNDAEVRNLLCQEAREKLKQEDLDNSRRARSTHPQLYEKYLRYMVVFEGDGFKAMFPCSTSKPDVPIDASLNATALRWDNGQWRMWPDSNEVRLSALIQHINLNRPFELDKLIIN